MNRKFLAFVAALSVLFLSFLSCKKIDTTDIGNDLIPVVDNVHTFDTVLEIISDNHLLPDSTRIRAAEDHALGFISGDPIFGRTTATIYVDMRPQVYGIRPFADKDSLVAIDSVVLSLKYEGTYGDTNSTVRFHVNEIDLEEEQSFKDSVKGYYIGQRDFGLVLPTLAVHDQIINKLNDIDTVYEGALKTGIQNQMRIKLPNSFGQRFFDYDTSAYKNDSAFRTKFIGFSIRPDSTFGAPNALAYFNLIDASTKMSIYYRAKKVAGAGKVDSLVTTFSFSNNANANIIRRNIAGTEFATAVTNGPANEDKLYMYTSPGSFATLKIPGLSTLNNRIIHLAQLIVEKIPNTAGDDKFKTPDVLFLDCIDTSNTFRTIPTDFVYSNNFYNIERFGGFYRNQKYLFDISRYVQGIVTRKDSIYTLRLYAPYKTNTSEIRPGFGIITPADPSELNGMIVNPQVANGRAVVYGGNHVDASKRIRLRIIYSKL